jgi:hypothetical protein
VEIELRKSKETEKNRVIINNVEMSGEEEKINISNSREARSNKGTGI